ncbi:lon2, partial [Symbiodinium sp. CCMP2456]
VSAVNLPPGLQYGPRQAVGRAVAELTEVGFGRNRPVMDMGCAYHSFSKGELRVQLDLRDFPEVMKLISSSMSSMTCHHPGIEGLNVIARHYEGPSEKDRLAFHADNFVVGEWVFGCILRQDSEDDALTLCFRERDGPREFCMKEEAGHLYRQTAEARHHWSHGIPAGGRGPVRQSLTWRWLRPSFLLWSALEQRCDRWRQGRWLRDFVAACQAAGIEHEVVQQFLQRWLPVCAPAAWEVPPPDQRKQGPKLPRTLQQRLERRFAASTSGPRAAK